MRSPCGLALGIALATAGCGPDAAGPAPPAPPTFELRPVVHPAIARLRAELGGDDVPVADAETTAEVRGLVTFVGESDGPLRTAAHEDVRRIGDGAVGPLRAIAANAEEDAGARAAAIELLGALGSRAAARGLVPLLAATHEPWVRSHAAWRLAGTEEDWVVPHLLERLKYEKDWETVVWIADALASLGNLSGLEGLATVAASAPDGSVRDTARDRLARIAGEHDGVDAAELSARWWAGELDVAPERSAAFDLEIWERIAHFEDFQLRGVDDSRFVLSRMDAHAAGLLAEALHDENVYVRVHVAQSLQRMGPRGRIAGDQLIGALAAPELAPHAAIALGRIRFAPAAGELRRLLAPSTDAELRLACVRALGLLGGPLSADALRPLLAGSEAPEIRQAAAEGLVSIEGDEGAVSILLDLLLSDDVEPAPSERALRAWLARRAGAGDGVFRRALEAWDELAPAAGAIVPPEQASRGRRARVELVRSVVGG